MFRDGFVTKIIEWGSELTPAVGRLRYRIFCKELNWVISSDSSEQDRYDPFAAHFVVLDPSGKLVGYARALTETPWGLMIENEFPELLDSVTDLPPKDEAFEVSRLVVEPGYRRLQITMLLYRAIYRWAKKQGRRYWVVVVTPSYLRALKRLFPFRSISHPHRYQGGVVSVAAVLDNEEAESQLAQGKPELLKWFQDGLEDEP